MKQIHFIQYLRPDGRQTDIYIQRTAEIAEKAERIMQAGYRLECEVLLNGLVSFTIGDDDGDCAHELCENGPGIEEVVDRLIIGFPLSGNANL